MENRPPRRPKVERVPQLNPETSTHRAQLERFLRRVLLPLFTLVPGHVEHTPVHSEPMAIHTNAGKASHTVVDTKKHPTPHTKPEIEATVEKINPLDMRRFVDLALIHTLPTDTTGSPNPRLSAFLKDMLATDKELRDAYTAALASIDAECDDTTCSIFTSTDDEVELYLAIDLADVGVAGNGAMQKMLAGGVGKEATHFPLAGAEPMTSETAEGNTTKNQQAVQFYVQTELMKEVSGHDDLYALMPREEADGYYSSAPQE